MKIYGQHNGDIFQDIVKIILHVLSKTVHFKKKLPILHFLEFPSPFGSHSLHVEKQQLPEHVHEVPLSEVLLHGNLFLRRVERAGIRWHAVPIARHDPGW